MVPWTDRAFGFLNDWELYTFWVLRLTFYGRNVVYTVKKMCGYNNHIQIEYLYFSTFPKYAIPKFGQI